MFLNTIVTNQFLMMEELFSSENPAYHLYLGKLIVREYALHMGTVKSL
jgi:hypothetical protein